MFARELKVAVRSLWKAKTLAVAVIVTLALGIGVNVAILSLVRAVLLKPGFAEALYRRGGLYLEEKDYDRAIADFDAALRIDPQYRDAIEARRRAYLRRGLLAPLP